MALIVETGAGLANAESYISVVDATAYHAARGNAAWAALASDTVREQVLRKATDYMGEVYRQRWAGTRISTAQALDWPRSLVPMRDGPGSSLSVSYYPNNAVPLIVAQVCAELALKASASPLAPDETQAIKRKKVGPVEIEYQDYSRATKTYRAIDNRLGPFLGGGGAGAVKVIRA